ncbi:hypothetical protein [Bradyrhizobium jicamae]|nr:hypothetical protein [Bradyrhizobium jicamae]
MDMPLHPTAGDIAIRLALALAYWAADAIRSKYLKSPGQLINA